jgi:hypothetical protein
VGVAQFLEQLLAVAAVVEDKVGKDDVETIAFDLAYHFGRIAGAMHRRDSPARRASDAASRGPGQWRSTIRTRFLVRVCCKTSSISSLSSRVHAFAGRGIIVWNLLEIVMRGKMLGAARTFDGRASGMTLPHRGFRGKNL